MIVAASAAMMANPRHLEVSAEIIYERGWNFLDCCIYLLFAHFVIKLVEFIHN